MRTWLAISTLVFAAAPGTAQQPADSAAPPEVFHGCPLEGVATGIRHLESNRQKNRTTHPSPKDIDSTATISAIMKPGNDEGRWSEERGASIVGYVVEVKGASPESANCDAKDRAFRDTHIALVADPADSRETARVIVEVTPRWRAFMAQRGQNWSSDALHRRMLHHWVRVTGWLFWDYEHADASAHTARRGANSWRATAWEIHPITGIMLCPAGPLACR